VLAGAAGTAPRPDPLIATAPARPRHRPQVYDQQIAARTLPAQTQRRPDTDGYQRIPRPAPRHTPAHVARRAPRGFAIPRDGFYQRRRSQPPEEPPKLPQTAIILPDALCLPPPDLPYGTPPGARLLRHLAQHHRRPQRPPKTRPPGPRPARPPRASADRRPSIFTALLVAANIRKIRAWRALTASDKARAARRARRRRASLSDYLPDG
jgi:hypothetical protein